jgi:methionyl-tRNA synthetase
MGNRRTLVTSALPYANGSIHVGHLVEYIQTDIYVRFRRLLGDDVIYICADDTHGTPIEMRAAREGITPEALVARSAEEHQRDFAEFQIRFDHYGSTNCEENRRWSERIFSALRDKGHVEVREVEQTYCPRCGRFLPDRYVRGTCPKCKAEDQYGDQCEVCSTTYRPTDLVAPRCAECGTSPERRSSGHYFVRLADFTDRLKAWTAEPGRLQRETRRYVDAWLSEGLRDWDISRDAPYFGFLIPGETSKYFYVWLDAPVGYIATTERYCRERGLDVERDYWRNEDVAIHHFIGKDIVYFHTLFWPAMLMAAELRLPAAVHVHGFLTVNGEKMSKSRGTFINARTYLDHLDPSYLRYYYAAKLGGGADDIDLSFDDFANRVNAELVNKIVNLASRAIQFVAKRLDGRIGGMTEEGRALVEKALGRKAEVEAAYLALDYASAVRIACEVAESGNLYMQERAPFNVIKDDPEAARAICAAAANLCRIVATYVLPVVPGLASRILAMLGGEPTWAGLDDVLRDTAIGPFDRLLERVDPTAIERLIAAAAAETTPAAPAAPKVPPLEPEIDYAAFAKVDLRVARVEKAEAVPKADKLVRLHLDLGSLGKRTVLAGIRKSFEPGELEGATLIVVANLAPRKMRGEMSEGMILAAGEDESSLGLVTVPAAVPAGTRVR